MLKQGLELKQMQKLSPLQIQTIKLIELPIQELEQRVRKELEENPVLDEDLPKEKEDEGEAPREVSLSEYKEDDSIPSYRLRSDNYSKDERPQYNTFSVKESFTQSLQEQLGYRQLTEHQYAVASFLIGSLDDDGYLRRSIDNIVDDLSFRANVETNEEEILEMLKVTNSKDKVKELVSAFNDVAKAYNALTDKQKESDFGKAMAESLNTLKGRIRDAKQEMNSTGGIMEQLAQKFTINFDAIKLMNVGLKATETALKVAKDAFFASEANVDEWGRTMQAAEGVYEGFLNALNTGDISGYLSRIDDIVNAARAAYNELDRLGTMKTIQGPQMSAQQTENERMRMMIQTGRYIAPLDGRRATMQNGQLLTPEQIRRIEQQLQNGMQKVVGLVSNEVKQTGKAIDAYYNSLAKQNGMTLKA